MILAITPDRRAPALRVRIHRPGVRSEASQP